MDGVDRLCNHLLRPRFKYALTESKALLQTVEGDICEVVEQRKTTMTYLAMERISTRRGGNKRNMARRVDDHGPKFAT